MGRTKIHFLWKLVCLIGLVLSISATQAKADAKECYKIVFVADDSYASHIYVVNPDGSGQTQLTSDDNTPDYLPLWSPDGKHIVFVRIDETYHLFIMNSDGSDAHRLLKNPLDKESY